MPAEAPRDMGVDRRADVVVDRQVVDVPPDVNHCDRANWTFTPNYICDTPLCAGQTPPNKDPEGAIDNDPGTRYTTGRLQGSPPTDETVTIDFGGRVTISGLRLQTSSVGDGPAEYRVEYTTDLMTTRRFTPDVAGPGSEDLIISFPATAMRAIRVVQTGSKLDTWWSIHDLTATNCRN